MPSAAPLRVLVTAGPTWVPLDAVRHIGNVSSGRTGLEIARAFARAGAAVTLWMGPGRCRPTRADAELFRVRPFVTFRDLRDGLHAAVRGREADVLVHTAAVADYEPVETEPGKHPSRDEEWVLRLRRTPKIVDEVRALDPGLLLVKFKLEVGRSPEDLLTIARESRAASDADLLVANDLARMAPGRHPAVILDRTGVVGEVGTTEELATRLVELVTVRVGQGPGGGASG